MLTRRTLIEAAGAAVVSALAPRTVGYYFDPRHAVVEGGGVRQRFAQVRA
jgi:hypothetical protein